MSSRPSFPRAPSAARQAFTLTELLAALAVFSVLGLILAQVVAMTSQAITINTTKLDAAGQSRLFFDRLAADLDSRPRRKDLGLTFTSATGNDSFQFYSQVNSYSGTRQLAAVGYRIGTLSGTLDLERAATGTDWLATGNPVNFLPGATVPAPSEGDYQLLAPGIFRLEFCYLLSTGALSTAASSDFSNVSAVVVAVGVLDGNSRKVVTEAQLAQLAVDLGDVTNTHDPLSLWNAAMAASNFAPGIPVRAVQNLRLYERTFPIP